jgi:osmotically-inducible protein OsmY
MFRFLLALIVVILVGAWYFGYLPPRGTEPVRTGNGPIVNTEAARERGAELAGRTASAANEVAERTASAANQVAEKLDDAGLTAKIKSKMALDDTVKAFDIDVTTKDGQVTLTGIVHSAAERDRALALARETEGVKGVRDRLQVGSSPR